MRPHVGPISHVNVTFWLTRFWFILVTLVMCRHLELLLLWLLYGFLLYSFSSRSLRTGQQLWKQLRNSGQDYPLVCSKGPTAH